MAKGKAAHSSSGASMSKYDVEVEGRLKALEAVAHPVPTGATQKKVEDRLAALEKAVKVKSSSGGSSDEGLEGKVDAVISKLKQQFPAKFADF